MEHSSFNYNKSANNYEVMSHVEEDIYFETDILCEGIKESIAQLMGRESDVLANTYIQHCMFLIDDVLDYIRVQRKTTVHIVKNDSCETGDICRMIHLREVDSSQTSIRSKLDNFREAATFIYPKGIYPNYLFPLKAKMKFIDIFMNDLFYMEHKMLLPKMIEFPNALKFENCILN